MGEYADDILEGFVCEGCNEPMPDRTEPGYPRKCLDCRKAAKRELRQRTFDAPFICKSEAALHALRYWLKERPLFNATREAGAREEPNIGLGMMDADSGAFAPAGLILCAGAEYKRKAMELVQKAIRRRAPNGGREP